MSEYELYHHGIKGQKWGVRRYQNKDGSLTEAGAKRYGYGSVEVKRNDRGDADSYVISNKTKRMEVSRQSLRSLEEEADSAYRQAIAFYNDVSMRKVDKFMKKHPETIENGNKVVDQYMEEKLTDLLNRYGEDVGGSSSKSSGSSSKQSSSTKTSASKESSDHSETAIFDKAYAALEKKYPNFNKLSEDDQDELLFDYLEKSGLLDEL